MTLIDGQIHRCIELLDRESEMKIRIEILSYLYDNKNLVYKLMKMIGHDNNHDVLFAVFDNSEI